MAWIMDIRHRLDESGLPVTGGSVGNQAQFFGRIAAAGSAHRPGIAFQPAIQCWRRPAHRRCQGRVHVARRPDNAIEYLCPLCRDDGLVHGWERTCWDFSDVLDFEDEDGDWCAISLEEYEAARKVLTMSREAEAILYGAIMDRGSVVLSGSLEDMELLADDIAAEANHTRSPRLRQTLVSLCVKLADGL